MTRIYWRPSCEMDRFLTRLFNSWNQILQDYEKALGNQGLPYIYGERPNVGHLAISARNIGAFPWIEAPAPAGSGHPDLCVEHPRLPVTYWFEAKWIMPEKTRNRGPKEVHGLVRAKLSEARRAARDRQWGEGDLPIGIVFVPLAVDENHISEFHPMLWRRLAQEMVETRGGPDFAVVHMCSREIWTKGEHYCPGVSLFGSFAKRH